MLGDGKDVGTEAVETVNHVRQVVSGGERSIGGNHSSTATFGDATSVDADADMEARRESCIPVAVAWMSDSGSETEEEEVQLNMKISQGCSHVATYGQESNGEESDDGGCSNEPQEDVRSAVHGAASQSELSDFVDVSNMIVTRVNAHNIIVSTSGQATCVDAASIPYGRRPALYLREEWNALLRGRLVTNQVWHIQRALGERMRVVEQASIVPTPSVVATFGHVSVCEGVTPIFVRRGAGTVESRRAAAERRSSGRQSTTGKGGAEGSKLNFQRLNQWVWACSCGALVSYANTAKRVMEREGVQIRRHEGCVSKQHTKARFYRGRFERAQQLWARQLWDGKKIIIVRPKLVTDEIFMVDMAWAPTPF